MPFVAEYPQALFTLMSIWNELKDSGIDYEVFAINNYCPQAAAQIARRDKCPKCAHVRAITREDLGRFQHNKPDICGDKVRAYATMHPWLNYLEYTDKLSHWQAKNLGVATSTGDILFFMDAHCVISPGSLAALYRHYCHRIEKLNGTLHLPLTYLLERPGVALIYKIVARPEVAAYSYSFTRYRPSPQPYCVPCMSTCGMMMSRALYDCLGGWPKELGIYGGGEQFINYTLAVLGKSVNIFPIAPLHHFAEKRGYNYEYVDYKRNQIIATYMFGGEERARLFSKNCKLDQKTAARVMDDILVKCAPQRQRITDQQTIEIEEWYKRWNPQWQPQPAQPEA